MNSRTLSLHFSDEPYLCVKVITLAFSQSQILLAFPIHHFHISTYLVIFKCLLKVQGPICSQKDDPFTLFPVLDEKQSYRITAEIRILADISGSLDAIICAALDFLPCTVKTLFLDLLTVQITCSLPLPTCRIADMKL